MRFASIEARLRILPHYDIDPCVEKAMDERETELVSLKRKYSYKVRRNLL
jgi:hypothetical protein